MYADDSRCGILENLILPGWLYGVNYLCSLALCKRTLEKKIRNRLRLDNAVSEI